MEDLDLFANDLDLFGQVESPAEELDLFGDAPDGMQYNQPYTIDNPIDAGKAIGMELVAAIDRGVINFADFLANPVRVAAELVTGADIPTIREALNKSGILNVEGGYMEEGAGRDFVRAGGEVGVPMAAGLKGVQRAAGTAGSLTADFLGLGSTVDDAAMQGARTTAALVDDVKLGKAEGLTDDEVYDAAYSSAKRDIIEKNRFKQEEYDKAWADIGEEQTKALKKAMKVGPIDQRTVEVATDIEIPEGITSFSMSKVLNELESMHGVEPTKTLEVLRKRKGLNFDKDEVMRFDEADVQFKQQARTHKAETSFSDWLITPMSDTLRKRVGPQVGGQWERGVETATRTVDTIVERIGNPVSRVMKYVDENPEMKRKLLDLHLFPEKNMGAMRAMIKDDLGAKYLKSFDKFVEEAGLHNAEARRILYKQDEGFDDVYYIHTRRNPKAAGDKRGNQGRGWAGKLGNPANRKMEETFDRQRKPAYLMKEEELAEYENPLASHLRWMADQEHLMEVARKFKIRPALGQRSKSGDVFEAVKSKLLHDGLDESRAEEARRIMNDAYMGSTMAPHPAVRTVMDLAYAGTLAQFKSALLNMHDIFVSMVNQGVRPTLKALTQKNKNVFGKSLKQLGFGDNQNYGEFIRSFDDEFENSVWRATAEKVHTFGRWGFQGSGFAALDRIGKGVVARAAYNNAVRAAKAGRLYDEWGEVLRIDELKKVRRYLQQGKKIEEMPQEVGKIVEEAVFTKLGQQQLISVAGRPLAYAQHPNARPLYALSGFAIKQLALLRKNVMHEAVHGSKAKAGKYLAKYAAFAGLGYGLLDESRSAVFKDEDFEPEDILWGAVDQMAAVATLNRVGDTYSLNQFADDPATYLLESVLPPMGLVGAAGQDAADLVLKGEYNAELVRKFPVLGDFYKYYWSDKKDKPTKAEAYRELYEGWGEGEG